jgi:hypothetical protein
MERRLGVFENRVLSRTSRPMRNVVIGGRMKLYVELQKLYSSPNIIKMMKSRGMRLVGQIACMRAKLNAYRKLVRKPEGKRPL